MENTVVELKGRFFILWAGLLNFFVSVLLSEVSIFHRTVSCYKLSVPSQ